MNKLTLAVEDRHLKIYGTKTEMSKALLGATFKTSAEHKLYPKLTINIDSLENKLSTKALNNKEGNYYFGDSFKIGVISNTDSTEFNMVVLASNLPIWERGEVLGRLIAYGDD
ncbi:unnamed protein product, partial [Ectocarpus sp. 12 AP-2014]